VLVHMANLALMGSKSVNVVSDLHSDIIKNEPLKNFTSFILGSLTQKQMV